MPDTDDYAQVTGHETTCTAGFNDECSCGTAPTGLRDRLATWARHNALTDLEDAAVIDQLAHLVEAEIGRARDAAAAINGMRAKAEARAERAEARIAAVEAERDGWAEAINNLLRIDKPSAAIARVRELHRRANNGETCVYCAHGQRLGYDTTWPCDTIRALESPTEPVSNASYPREGEK